MHESEDTRKKFNQLKKKVSASRPAFSITLLSSRHGIVANDQMSDRQDIHSKIALNLTAMTIFTGVLNLILHLTT
jgi:hypothetical protein